MAIKKTITAQNNFGEMSVLPDCYCKVTRLTGDKTAMHFNVEVYNADKNRVYKTETVTFEPSVADGAKNFIAQAYDHLKTLPDYAGGTDC